MSKQIETLVDDIYGLFGSEKEFDSYLSDRFGLMLAQTVQSRIGAKNKEGKGTLRMSNMGTPCLRKLWYHVNIDIEHAEPLPPYGRVKFLYGDILEELLLYLATEAGHSVEGMQDELEIDGIKGHRDAVIDGVVVDIKSASTRSFQKFKNHLTKEEDAFGYIPQLMQYLWASQDDPLVTDKNRAAFLAIDKTLGHICVDIHESDGVNYDNYVNFTRDAINSPNIPSRAFSDEPDGMSGNMKLCTQCSYCEWKKKCWPGVRTYLYSGGPRYLTVVKKEPRVQESGTYLDSGPYKRETPGHR